MNRRAQLLLLSLVGTFVVVRTYLWWQNAPLTLVAFGAGLGLALDEFDGSNAAYWTPVSFGGGVILIFLASVYIIILTKQNSGV